MKRFTRNSIAVALATLLTASLASAAPPPVPPTPAPVLDIVSARPFTMEAAVRHDWRVERPSYTTGYLLVLKVDPRYVYPRQTEEPVLYVGHQTAQRVNVGYRSGHVIAIVPGVLDDPEHPDFIDLRSALMFFGTPQMPERVDRAAIDREVEAARAAGVRPLPAPRVDAALAAGGSALRVATKDDLVRESARLILKSSPQEKELAQGLLGTPAPSKP